MTINESELFTANLPVVGTTPGQLYETTKEVARMPENRIKVAPKTVAYADGETHKLVMEFAIPGAPTDTIDLKILPGSVHLTRIPSI
jgi:hypothetical protein